MKRRATLKLGVGVMLALGVVGQAVAGPYEDAHAAHLRNDPQAYLAIIRPLADRGEARAQNDLGSFYADGWGGLKDAAMAFQWVRKAADEGDPQAETNLGLMYLNGEGTPQDTAQAEVWIKKAADQGFAPAGLAMAGLMMQVANTTGASDAAAKAATLRASGDNGDPMARASLQILCITAAAPAPADCGAVINWTRADAAKGTVDGEVALARLYDRGFPGLDKDVVQAARWYRKAAEQGDASAQSSLAMRYELGEGVPTDQAQAIAWYRKAADQGDTFAQSALVSYYENDHSGTRDDAEAFYWNRKLAEKGLADAALALGSDYALGRGVAKDDVQAYMWLTVAMASSLHPNPSDQDTQAMALKSLADKMSPAQIAQAQNLASAWRARQADANTDSAKKP